MIGLQLPDREISVLCLAAHPDDVEIGCAGTLAQLVRRSGGARFSWLTLTGTEQRQAEARVAAAAIAPRARCRFLDLPDGRLPAHWSTVKEALHEFAAQEAGADIVFAPSSDDAHQDHALIGDLVPTVWRDQLVVNYEIPKWDGDFGRPNLYVPMDEGMAAAKIRLLDESFVSQRGRDWWGEDLFRAMMRVRGMECRSPYAEAFYLRKGSLDLR